MLETTAPHAGTVIPPPADHNPEHRPRHYRPDIEGLRAVAVLLVVVYHAHLLGVTGGYIGVDIFFVISGFLITRQLVSGVSERGFGELPGFYARRIRRLLPASCLVVVATIIATWYWAPATLARATFTDAIWTTFYGLNYRLAYNGTQYLHQGDAVSPLQHFWSLGVEEQFYVAWPVLIVLVFALPKRIRKGVLIGLLGAIFAVSLWYSITTSQGSTWAYFGLHTRAWELAAGGLVALASPALARLPRWFSNIGAWAGVAVIIACAWYLTDNTVYPGSAALIPVLACALVIACGCATRHHSIERLFAEPAIQGLGKVSYSWYLWHWPMLVLLPMMADESLNWVRRLEIVGLSLLFAVLTYHLVENPARRVQRLNFEWIRTGLGLAAVVVVAAVIATNILAKPINTGVTAKATVLQDGPKATKQIATVINASMIARYAPSNLTPTPLDAPDDYPRGCIVMLTGNQSCVGEPVLGDLHGSTTVALFGDSHARQWGSGLDLAGKKLGYKINVLTKAACPVADIQVYEAQLDREYSECDAWRPGAISQIISWKPKFVILSEADDVGGSAMDDKAWAAATVLTIERFQEAGVDVLYMLDTPHISLNVPDCVAEHLKSIQKCNAPRSNMYTFPTRHVAVKDAVLKTGVTVVEPAKWMCNKKGCPAIIGNILGWQDENGHMTATYSKWLAPVLARMLAAGA